MAQAPQGLLRSRPMPTVSSWQGLFRSSPLSGPASVQAPSKTALLHRFESNIYKHIYKYIDIYTYMFF